MKSAIPPISDMDHEDPLTISTDGTYDPERFFYDSDLANQNLPVFDWDRLEYDLGPPCPSAAPDTLDGPPGFQSRRNDYADADNQSQDVAPPNAPFRIDSGISNNYVVTMDPIDGPTLQSLQSRETQPDHAQMTGPLQPVVQTYLLNIHLPPIYDPDSPRPMPEQGDPGAERYWTGPQSSRTPDFSSWSHNRQNSISSPAIQGSRAQQVEERPMDSAAAQIVPGRCHHDLDLIPPARANISKISQGQRKLLDEQQGHVCHAG